MALAVLSWPLTLDAKVDDDIYEMSLDENLESPEIKNDKQADKIQEFQYDMAVAFSGTAQALPEDAQEPRVLQDAAGDAQRQHR